MQQQVDQPGNKHIGTYVRVTLPRFRLHNRKKEESEMLEHYLASKVTQRKLDPMVMNSSKARVKRANRENMIK